MRAWTPLAVGLGLVLSACSTPRTLDRGVIYATCDESSFALSVTGTQAVLDFLGREPVVLPALTSQDAAEESRTYTNGRHTVVVDSRTGQVSYARGRMRPQACDLSQDPAVLRAVVDTTGTADPASKPAGDWSRHLFDVLPAIEQCLAGYVGDLPRVLIAWPMNRGYVGMRLVNQNGGRTDCLSDSVNTAYEMLAFDEPAKPGEGQPHFTPRTSAPPFHPDFRHEKVVRDNTLYGWLSYRDN